MRTSASGRLPRCVRPVSRGRRPPSPAVEKEAERAQFCDPCNERDSQIPASVDTVLSALGYDRALSVMATVFTPHAGPWSGGAPAGPPGLNRPRSGP